jgi:hypothetical protein
MQEVVIRSDIPCLSDESVELINSKVNFLYKAKAVGGGYIIRREVGLGFVKLNKRGSFVCTLPESYLIDPENYFTDVKIEERDSKTK